MSEPMLSGYDPVLRVLHWLSALMILSAVLIGLRMTRLPMDNDADFAAAMRVFSIHKTIGVAIFLTALLRILWAFARPRPGPLHPERRIETFLAALVHWTLYGAMLLMPLSGWLYSSANPGYAPILLPVPQVLPFVPATEAASDLWKSVHQVSAWLLYGAVALHVAGAFRHAVIDMDATMARMISGAGTAVPPARFHALPAALAGLIWAATIAAGIALAPAPEPDPFEALDAGAEIVPPD